MGTRHAGPYEAIYTPWLGEWQAANMPGLQWSVMAAVCDSTRMQVLEDGRAYGWFSREGLAEHCKVKPGSVTAAVKALRQRGFLKVKTKAHRGHCAEYWIMPGHPWPRAGKGGTKKAQGRGAPGAESPALKAALAGRAE